MKSIHLGNCWGKGLEFSKNGKETPVTDWGTVWGGVEVGDWSWVWRGWGGQSVGVWEATVLSAVGSH